MGESAQWNTPTTGLILMKVLRFDVFIELGVEKSWDGDVIPLQCLSLIAFSTMDSIC